MASDDPRCCLLLYFYTYCLALGTACISVILAWTEQASLPSSLLMTSSLTLSAGTMGALAALSLGPSTEVKVKARAVLTPVGLVLTALLLGAGTFVTDTAAPLYYVCGLLSSGLHLLTCCVHIVQTMQKRRPLPARRASILSFDYADTPSHVVVCTIAIERADQARSSIPEPGLNGTRVRQPPRSPIDQLGVYNLPAFQSAAKYSSKPPEYADIVGDSPLSAGNPPSYSDVMLHRLNTGDKQLAGENKTITA
ncbi:uncharacterized protein LOC131949816 [Physella acuta]|uniref:uncharacterized protein LOC131949816 n=1 Tax=Physella acuta TaxID=109671 RepID=UPI0027DB192C|nr:uncharacterized protein LOC131949816 [Physella acuta]